MINHDIVHFDYIKYYINMNVYSKKCGLLSQRARTNSNTILILGHPQSRQVNVITATYFFIRSH